MAAYKLLKDGYIQRASDGACVPPDTTNADYQEYLAWIDDDNIPDPQDPEFEETWDGIRTRRNDLLKASDWTQISDSPLNQTEKDSWATYRQTLRDLPQTYQNVEDVVWPVEP